MKKDSKDKMIGIRVTEEEKALIEETAKASGFDNVSSFFLWLWRKFGKKA
jgi:uncharacterized protein (DUF1778 family)